MERKALSEMKQKKKGGEGHATTTGATKPKPTGDSLRNIGGGTTSSGKIVGSNRIVCSAKRRGGEGDLRAAPDGEPRRSIEMWGCSQDLCETGEVEQRGARNCVGVLDLKDTSRPMPTAEITGFRFHNNHGSEVVVGDGGCRRIPH